MQDADALMRFFVKNVYIVAEMKGFQINYVERYAGVSAGYLSRILKGGKGLSFRIAILLADAVDETITDLLTRDYSRVAVETQIGYLEKRIDELKKQLD